MPEFYMIPARIIIRIPEFFMTFARKINKIPEFYMIFVRKMPEIYTIIARKIVFSFLGGVNTNSQLVGDSFVVSSVWTHPSAVVTQFTISGLQFPQVTT